MTEPFDWAGLWDAAWKAWDDAPPGRQNACNRDATEVLRTRIEAAFVPKEWRDCQVNAGRQLLAEATARAEAAEARVKALLESIGILEAALKAIAGSHWERWGMDQTDINEVPDHSGEEAMEIARAALGEDHDK